MSRFMAPRYSLFDSYVPGEQPQDRQYLKLNTNESPFAPAPAVLKAITAGHMADLRLYPDPECVQLSQAIAALYQVKPEQVLCGNGSDELLSFAFMAWGQHGAAFADVTYGLYQVLCDLHGVKARRVPLRDDYTMDDRDYLGLKQLIVLANPNAPTGQALLPRQVAHIAESNPDHVVLVDEAYVDFGADSCVPLVNRHENIVVVQTMSKSRGLAGLRLGYAIGPTQLIRDLRKLKNAINPYNVDRLAQLAGLAAVGEQDHYQMQARAVMQVREHTARQLKALGFTVLPSLTNFVFAKHPAMGGEALYLALKKRGILVRYFGGERTRAFVRITIGTREQMDECLAALKEIVGGASR